MGWGTSMLVFGEAGSGGQANCHMAVILGAFVMSSISPLKPKIMWLLSLSCAVGILVLVPPP